MKTPINGPYLTPEELNKKNKELDKAFNNIGDKAMKNRSLLKEKASNK